MRPLLLILSLLLSGAAINALVTWSSARFTDHRPNHISINSTPITALPAAADKFLNDPEFIRGTLADKTANPTQNFVTDPKLAHPDLRETGVEVEERRSLLCTRSDYTRWIDRPFMGHSRTHAAIQFGFPFRSMSYTQWHMYSSTWTLGPSSLRPPGPQGGWPIAPSENEQAKWLYRDPAHIYPLTPIPLGFAANTLIYAILLYALTLAPRHIRNHSRRRRNLCLKCAYPIGVSPVCTECGTRITVS